MDPDQDSMQCQRCGHLMVPVTVAGHTQCPYCHQVVDECCSGETVGIQEETA